MTVNARKPVDHPLLPGEANVALSVVSFLFASSGVLLVLAFAVGIVGKIAGWQLMADIVVRPLAVGISLITAIGYLATAWLLSRRRRLGGLLGACFTGLSLVSVALAPDPIGVADVLWPAALLVALALSWSHLSSAGSPPADH